MCALDGFQVAVPDTDANRAYFGSSGTADNTAPFPQARGIIATAAGSRGTLGLEFGPSGDGEQTLTRRMVRHHREVFAAGRLFLVDRNFPGFELIKDIRQVGAHLLMRVKSDIVLPLPDGSYRSFLAGRDCCIPLRVIEYDVAVPGDPGRQNTGPWNRRPARSDIRVFTMPDHPSTTVRKAQSTLSVPYAPEAH